MKILQIVVYEKETNDILSIREISFSNADELFRKDGTLCSAVSDWMHVILYEMQFDGSTVKLSVFEE